MPPTPSVGCVVGSSVSLLPFFPSFPIQLSLSLSLHLPPRFHTRLASPPTQGEGGPRSSGVAGGVKGARGNGGLRTSWRAEGRWLKWGGVQSDYAKLCPYVLTWKFHPSPGSPPRLGKCIYCCLSSVLYMATAGRDRRQGGARVAENRPRLKLKKKIARGRPPRCRA